MAVGAGGVADGRRRRRRQQTLDEILEMAVQAMAEDGVAGMSLSDVARRVGMQPPSLYEYFANKLAIYDAVFRTGYEQLNSELAAGIEGLDDTPLEALRVGQRIFIRWCLEHAVMAQLMLWRPVPGFRPSESAYRAAVAQWESLRRVVRRAVDCGELAPAADSDEGLSLCSFIGSGVVTQQLANEPTGGYDEGRFSQHAAAAFEMWIARYSPTGRSATIDGKELS